MNTFKRGFRELIETDIFLTEIPDTYKETVFACHEFMGDIVYKIAPLTKHRNEAIHQYLKINWQNIITVKNKIPEIEAFYNKAKEILES
ncbi:hypothetical protein V4D30_05325 [Thermodesulfovibrio sp. 3907-1M]|uniref:DUF86 domain-containing protein n=1 Tax=Thermodesulfovibrio autotrophicus TaxID=3118333 RepID=A0AAU8GT40_9BACT